jgi:hypothetical protein
MRKAKYLVVIKKLKGKSAFLSPDADGCNWGSSIEAGGRGRLYGFLISPYPKLKKTFACSQFHL